MQRSVIRLAARLANCQWMPASSGTSSALRGRGPAGGSGSGGQLLVKWDTGSASSFNELWLRDHAQETLHPTSLQRQLESAQLKTSSTQPEVGFGPEEVRLSWSDGAVSTLSANFLWQNDYGEAAHRRRRRESYDDTTTTPAPWRRAFEPTQLACRDVAQNPRAALQALLRDGIVVIQGVDAAEDKLLPVAELFGVVRRTFYTPRGSGLWDTAPKQAADVNDTAYTNIALPPHTDCTYYTMPPGLQAFCCAAQATDGGSTIFVDGFEIARQLRRQNPAAFNFFATVPLEFHKLEKGVHCLAKGTVFKLDESGRIVHFRYNNDDRAPLRGLTPAQVEEFYRHLPALTATMRSPELVLKLRLNVGDLAIINNHRVLHGRDAFNGYRNMVGFYTDMDDFLSKCRVHNLDTETLGAALDG